MIFILLAGKSMGSFSKESSIHVIARLRMQSKPVQVWHHISPPETQPLLLPPSPSPLVCAQAGQTDMYSAAQDLDWVFPVNRQRLRNDVQAAAVPGGTSYNMERPSSYSFHPSHCQHSHHRNQHHGTPSPPLYSPHPHCGYFHHPRTQAAIIHSMYRLPSRTPQSDGHTCQTV